MRSIALAKRETTIHDSPSEPLFHKNKTCAKQHHTSWCSGILTEKGWSSDFPPLPSAFSDNSPMAFMLRSHNGVHCCGTVGDLHSRSQLSAVKHTSMGDSTKESRCKDTNKIEKTHVLCNFFDFIYNSGEK